ncbi:hypothetical protein CH276_01095 [Rhodococcus sp. 06-470-2]|uniref:hypothetical protein n=1 Tax=unclassified Rhodococcus (in: high G+C Gram-positive bacteria) TaxID=192944 RepID=UPI000B9BB09A|nr:MULTISPECIES: hypothetical protein [unclassified Rhodococcus (in: high G+C Gram-positive bacteria)]OZC70715.1 hypothetical protein CH276_01095 [Rhodococcus sp. 06-470-2]OZE72018.1 hypothetical protein CH265_01000 [Rhodococcus sp. 05-2221-1B]
MTALGVLLTGLLAGLSMQPDGIDILGDAGFGGVLFSSGGGGVAVAVILASGLAMFVRRRSILAGLSVAAAVAIGGSVLLLSSDFVEVVAGGVLLGCSAVHANRERVRQALLAASFVLGLLSTGAIEALQYSGIPRRYADYLAESELGTPVVVPVLCVLVGLAAAWAARVESQAHSPATDRGVRTGSAILLVAIGGLLLDMLFGHSVFHGEYGFSGRWYFGLFVVPVLFGAAGLLPGRGGVTVLAGTAVLLASTTTSGVGISASDWVWTLGLVAVIALSVVAGAALGLRWGRPMVGVRVLAVVCATALFAQPPLDNVHYVASLIVFPAATAYLYVACTPADPAPATLGLAVPVAITVPMVVTYGWTAYMPLTSVVHSSWPSTELWLSTGAAVATVVLCGVGMWALGRRPLSN